MTYRQSIWGHANGLTVFAFRTFLCTLGLGLGVRLIAPTVWLRVPFHVEGKAVGTIWAIAHDKRRTFDRERVAVDLSVRSARWTRNRERKKQT